MKSKLGLIALGTIGLLVASCSNTSSIATPSVPSSTPSSLPPSTSPSSSTLSSSSSSSAQTVVLQNYGYSFVGTTLNASGGSLSANGLTWDYGSLAYAGPGDDRGTQIGSSKKPQTDPWTIETDFGESVVIKEIEIVLATANGGSGKYAVEAGDWSSSGTFASQAMEDRTLVKITDLAISATDFSLSLSSQASKALYLNQIAFLVETASDSALDLSDSSVDIGGDTPDEPSQEDPIVPGKGEVPDINFEPISLEVYYADVDFSASGPTLENTLHDLVSDMHFTSYDDARYMLQYTDESLTQPGYVYCTYDGANILAEWKRGTTWNREHTWPQSRLIIGEESHAKNDLHNLRAANNTINSGRGNQYFDEESGSSDSYFPNLEEDDFRGDVARICFYMAIRYDGLKLSDNPNEELSVSMGKLSTLLRWNKEDPVSDFERQRNDRIYCYQHNRNPFIDHPEIADRIFE